MRRPKPEPDACTCPKGMPWPYVTHHSELDGSPVCAVSHHPQQCVLPSLRLNGYRLSPEDFERVIAAAIGSRAGAKAK